MDKISELLGSVPQPVQWALAGIGALYVSGKVLGYLQLVMNLFVLSGTNVSTPTYSGHLF
jgi:17beta-estradiol 17-dehydrogenase / very-long-chain 3-oxoacyl-CoA reductase